VYLTTPASSVSRISFNNATAAALSNLCSDMIASGIR
jgi:hypothetical protein